MSQEIISKKNVMHYVHSLIVIALMFGFGFFPPFGQVTEMGMKILGVFAGMLWGWIFIEMIWPSVLGMIAFGMTGAVSVTAAFSGGYGHNMVLTVLMVLLFSELLNQCHITDYIANKCLSSKWVIGRPWTLVAVFFVADFLISVLASNLAATFLLWVAFVKVAETAGLKKGDKFVSYMICGICYIGVISLMILPFKTAALVFVGFFTSGTGLTIDYLPYLAYMSIITGVQIVVYFLLGKYVFRFDLSKLGGDEDRFADMRGIKATFEQKVGMVFIAVFIVLLFMPAFLPKAWGITQLLNNWGIIGVSGIMLVVGAIMRGKDGKQFVSIATTCKRGISWDIIWLLAATYPIADAIKSPDCGIMATVSSAITPYLHNMNPVVFMILCMLILGVITQFVHNVVLAAMFIPMMTTLCIGMGGNPYVIFFMMYWALQTAYTTPGASMQGAMMFGHEWVTRSHGYLFGMLYLVMIFIIMIVIGIPLGNLIF